MRCPYCNHPDSRVIDSRETEDGKVIRRRRECEKCKSRFSTYEQIELLKLIIVKKDGRKEEYKKEKLEEGIRRASNKRLKEDQIGDLISGIESQLQAGGETLVSSKLIGDIALKLLKEKDEVSYLRFASVFKSFGSGKRFVKELNKLEKESDKIAPPPPRK
jgi:transcriptional repressor NrdR